MKAVLNVIIVKDQLKYIHVCHPTGHVFGLLCTWLCSTSKAALGLANYGAFAPIQG